MVIIGTKSGQLGNRLLVFAHFIANSIEFGYEVHNPSFYDCAPYFASTRDDFYCRYPARKSTLASLGPVQGIYLKLVTRSLWLYKKLGLKGLDIDALDINPTNCQGENYDMSNPDFLRLVQGSRVLLIRDGWLFRDFRSLQKHADLVRRFFVPIDKHAGNVARLIAQARQGCDLLVGVHIRQGDYRGWLNGRYYYTSEQYADLMSRFAQTLKGKRVKYLICSNVAQNERLFAGMDYLMGTNHKVEDLYAFAQCDYLVGPPSTYTMWASFYGSVPLYTVQAPDAPLTVGDFAEKPWA